MQVILNDIEGIPSLISSIEPDKFHDIYARTEFS
jgi:hypothetical protein